MNVEIDQIRVPELHVNVTGYLLNSFLLLRTLSKENIICSGHVVPQKDNLMSNEDVNLVEIQIPLQIEHAAEIQMDHRYYSMQQSKNVALIFLLNLLEPAK